MATMYTHVPRAVLWLLRGDEAQIGGEGGDTEPAHVIELGSFYMSRGPISNRQFEAFRGDHTRHPLSGGDDDPAIVSFQSATAYADWYANLAKKPFRLPTEAEWEFAARASGAKRYPWGEAPAGSDGLAWTLENSGSRCHPVDTPKPTKNGLYGMIGNVWEWTSSLYLPYPIGPDDGRDDPSNEGPRVIRGGCIYDPIETLSCGRREQRSPETGDELIGFRIVRDL